MSEKGTVLVTGGSGFIGSWCVIELLRQGYAVRTTLRSRESATRAAIGKQVDVQDRLRFYAAELTTDAGWDAAASGCDYILHVASPVAVSEPKNPDELIVPARDGTRRAIGAGLKAGVKRVVLTSSVAAASPRASARESVSDETVWTDLDDPKVSAYARSKTLAERAAWDQIGASGGATTLARAGPQSRLFRVRPARRTPAVRQSTWFATAGL
jgi:nucleoside-diphosphate-sugar epimerase